MEPNYLILLNYCVGEIVKIKLTEEEKRLRDCEWMTLETLSERTYNMKGGDYA